MHTPYHQGHGIGAMLLDSDYHRADPAIPSRAEFLAWAASHAAHTAAPSIMTEPHGPVGADAATLAIADAIAHGGGDEVVMAKVRRIVDAVVARATVPGDCPAL